MTDVTYMFRYVCNREEAEGLTEQIFVQAVRATPPGATEPPTLQSLNRLLCRTACAVVAVYLGQFYPHYRAAPADARATICADDISERRTQNAGASDVARRILARLLERDRELLTYRLLLNLSLAETVGRMRISTRAALALLWSALTNAARIAANEPAGETAHSPTSYAAPGDNALERDGG